MNLFGEVGRDADVSLGLPIWFAGLGVPAVHR